jgi:hypothetical protein
MPQTSYKMAKIEPYLLSGGNIKKELQWGVDPRRVWIKRCGFKQSDLNSQDSIEKKG